MRSHDPRLLGQASPVDDVAKRQSLDDVVKEATAKNRLAQVRLDWHIAAALVADNATVVPDQLVPLLNKTRDAHLAPLG